jgi:hypothetical protein
MKRSLSFLFLLFVLVSTASAQSRDDAELYSIAQTLLDAVAHGDTMAWERNVHRDFYLTDEAGNVVPRAEMLSYLRSLPASHTDRIRLGRAIVRRVGKVAILYHRDLEHAEIGGQPIDAEYQTTDTYVKIGGRWQLLASHVMALPQARKVASVDPSKLREAEGTYELQPGVTYEVRVDNGRLVGQRSGSDAEVLLPVSTDVFFREGTVRGEKLFTRDAEGKVVALVDRRDNIDVVWKRVSR